MQPLSQTASPVDPALVAWWDAFDPPGVPGTGLGEALALATRYLAWREESADDQLQLQALIERATLHYGVAPATTGRSPDREWLELWAKDDVRRGHVRWHGASTQPSLHEAAKLALAPEVRPDPDGTGSGGTSQRYWRAVAGEIARQQIQGPMQHLALEAEAVGRILDPSEAEGALRTFTQEVLTLVDLRTPLGPAEQQQLAAAVVRLAAGHRVWREVQWTSLDQVRQQLAESPHLTPADTAPARQSPATRR